MLTQFGVFLCLIITFTPLVLLPLSLLAFICFFAENLRPVKALAFHFAHNALIVLERLLEALLTPKNDSWAMRIMIPLLTLVFSRVQESEGKEASALGVAVVGAAKGKVRREGFSRQLCRKQSRVTLTLCFARTREHERAFRRNGIGRLHDKIADIRIHVMKTHLFIHHDSKE